ncbi:carbamoyltransferase C-terminal domain-containing protein [Bradyrhizobium sp. 190]|uniref:carbamoyltransferase C-terminal domain-containing protein n=1 Tax=Bradyrhizobium sp. 190 TaxID=2782658 RepID=UPI001FF9B249|nr:carbamoyltransferase C-terminal domain-containing protein [Bradyrhizobium sp. 190]
MQAVGKVTGREMVLNTSFNVKGQPIVKHQSSFTNAMAVYAANLTTTDDRLRNLDHLCESLPG